MEKELYQRTGPVSHQEAGESLLRFVNSHFQRQDEGKPCARFTIPANPRRDDDLRMHVYIDQCEAAAKERDELKAENERLRGIVERAAQEKVNGYDTIKLLLDIKKLSIDHGGYQNAYAISHVVDVIESARKALAAKPEVKPSSVETRCDGPTTIEGSAE